MWWTTTSSLLLASALTAAAQTVKWDKQLPPGDYSGIAHIAGDTYAMVSDKSATDGFFVLHLGDSLNVRSYAWRGSGLPNRDGEGIAFFAPDSTLFVSGEADGRILEYRMDGRPTGRELAVPPAMRRYAPNRGFEALSYNAATHRFWTTTESPLPADTIQGMLRLQSFGDDLLPADQHIYIMDAPRAKSRGGRLHAHGVSGIAAMDDGTLIVLEREFYVAKRYIGSWVEVRLYAVRPPDMAKRLIARFRTKLNLTARSLANYEGLCIMPGGKSLLLVSDSQSRYKGVLHDWAKKIDIEWNR